MKICLYGSASDNIDQKYKDAVYDLGALMAKGGHTMVYGGGCQGLMGSASRGVYDNGGKIIGVCPEFFKHTQVKCLFDHCDQIIDCETMYQRKNIMEDISDCFVVTPGGIGTYDEFFGVVATRQLKRHNKPIAIFNCFGFFDSLINMISEGKSLGFIGDYNQYFKVFSNPKDILDYFENR